MSRPRGLPWSLVLRRTVRGFSAHSCTDLAAGLTYFAVLSSVPALLAVVSVLGLFGQRSSGTHALLDVIDTVAPGSVQPILHSLVAQILASPAAGWALVIGVLGAVWTASGYVGAFGRAMNRLYEVPEGRGALKRRPLQLLNTVVLLALVVIAALALVLSGPIARAIGHALAVGDTVLAVWSVLKWPLLAVVVIAAVALLYWVTPNVRRPRFRVVSLGAAVAVVVLVLASVGFGLYVSNFGHYDRTYGALGGLVVLLLWIWIANIALLLGAELDVEVERARELLQGLAAEEHLQLPVRDSRTSDKAAAVRDRDVRAAREIRDAVRAPAGGPDGGPGQ